MNVFELREKLIDDYSSYIRSFIRIRDGRVEELVTSCLDQGLLWPDPLIQLNPAFQYAGTIEDLVTANMLHPECRRIFRGGKDRGEGKPLRLYQHQADAISRARAGRNYVLTTGTGSGKSLAYIIPIVDHVLGNGTGRGIQAIVVYPMNALANSQFGELHKFLRLGYPDGKGPVAFARYTGQEGDEERNAIVAKGDDISGEHLLKRREEIEKRFLVTIAHYGKVILRSNRADFDRDVEELRKEVEAFQKSAKEKLNQAIRKNCAEVIARLLPIVRSKPPQRWQATLGSAPSEDLVRRRLEEDLTAAYGDASNYLDRIDLRLIYKDITVEMLRDADFAKAAKKAKLYLDEMYEEYQAARARE